MKIYYGIENNNIDVTEICLSKLLSNNIITIPSNDFNRAYYFGDPVFGVLKQIFISINDDNTKLNYENYYKIYINITTNEITVENETDILNKKNIDNKLNELHSKLTIKHGSFKEEVPEQKMALMYLKGHENVLEIGGNIGRNSLIIGSILQNSKNLVTLESDKNISKQLIENRNLNNLHFHVENSALSIKKMIQKGWETIQSDNLLDGYKWVNTITLETLKNKYNIVFDTLVLDCEGAFYYILLDMPNILDNINLIIMENDYYDISKKEYVDKILIQNKFIRNYVENGGWGPCYNNFFEVWKK
jgi:FkbM family methyltransferase